MPDRHVRPVRCAVCGDRKAEVFRTNVIRGLEKRIGPHRAKHLSARESWTIGCICASRVSTENSIRLRIPVSTEQSGEQFTPEHRGKSSTS
jgi:hypothetical protein